MHTAMHEDTGALLICLYGLPRLISNQVKEGALTLCLKIAQLMPLKTHPSIVITNRT